MNSFRCLLIWLMLTVAWAAAQPTPTPAASPLDVKRVQKPFEVSLHAEKDRWELAQGLRLTYTIEGPEQAELIFPSAEKLNLKPFEVRDAAPVTMGAKGDRRTWEYRVKITAYETGKLKLPETVISARIAPKAAAQELTLPGLEFQIDRVSAGPNDKPDEVRDAKNLSLQGVPLVVILAVALALLLLGLLLWLLVKWWRRPRRVVQPPALAPYPWALQQLDQLTSERLDQQGQFEAFYDQLTHVLRFYLGWRFQMPLLEQTTSEILRSLQLPDPHYRPAKDLLETADMVKFARSFPSLESSQKHLEWARQIVEENPPQEDAPAKTGEAVKTPEGSVK